VGAPRKYKLSPKRVDSGARSTLRRHIQHAQKANDLSTWKRARAVLAYVEGGSIADIGSEVGADPSTVSRWIAAYALHGVPALSPAKAPGPLPRLREEQLEELGRIVEKGPESAGFDCGVWTGRLVGELIRRKFGVDYHWKYIPELLHKLGFSCYHAACLMDRCVASEMGVAEVAVARRLPGRDPCHHHADTRALRWGHSTPATGVHDRPLSSPIARVGVSVVQVSVERVVW
jgi:transposase